MVAPTLPLTRLAPVEVFAVEDRSAQVVWRGLPPGTVRAVVDGQCHDLGPARPPGAAELTGLRAGTTHHIEILVDDRRVAELRARTEAELPGREQLRVATISDLHLGEEGFGLVKPLRERPTPPELHPLRCAKAAVREAVAWGAQLLVIKGDITESGEPWQWELFDEFLDAVPIPVWAVPGNHDTVGMRESVSATDALQARGLFPAPVHAADVEGVRVVAADTTVPRHSWGRMRRRLDDLAEAVDVGRPALVFMHHHLQTTALPWFWPLGIPRGDGAAALDGLLETNPDLLISSGHTHRNRVRSHGSAVVTEVGSTKDHPGVWAGYVVTDRAVRQVVRRVADPSCIAWTDRCHAAVGGIWGRWSPGRLPDRVVTHTWKGPAPVTTLRGSPERPRCRA